MKKIFPLDCIIKILKGAIAAVIIATIFAFATNSSYATSYTAEASTSSLPNTAFPFPQEAYDAIGDGILSLNHTIFAMKIPDLSHDILFHGLNARPDIPNDTPQIILSLSGSSDIICAASESKIFLVYDDSPFPGRYIAGDDTSPLSIIPTYTNGGAVISTSLVDDAGNDVEDTASITTFELLESPLITEQASWEVGTYRADAGILARQRARWFGKDRFLEHHGGEEYNYTIGRERIDFGDGEEAYPLFVKKGDYFFWEDDKWIAPSKTSSSQGKALLAIASVEEKLIHIDLWNDTGTKKLPLTIIKSSSVWSPHIIQHEISFLGAKTKIQAIVEISKERMILNNQDWVLRSDNKWSVIKTPKNIDEYVMNAVTGELFVVGDIIRKDGKQFLEGTLFNRAKTETVEMAIPLQASIQDHRQAYDFPAKTPPQTQSTTPTHKVNTEEQELKRKEYEERKKRGRPPLIKLHDTIRGALQEQQEQQE